MGVYVREEQWISKGMNERKNIIRYQEKELRLGVMRGERFTKETRETVRYDLFETIENTEKTC